MWIPPTLDGEDKTSHQQTVAASSSVLAEPHTASRWNNKVHVYKLPLRCHHEEPEHNVNDACQESAECYSCDTGIKELACCLLFLLYAIHTYLLDDHVGI